MLLKRYSGNPILSPTEQWWESKSVCNAAAVWHNGRVHMLYRAMGDDPLSRFGLAVSDDGYNFTRFDLPVFEGDTQDPWERLGVEDPRIVEIDGLYYITYVAASVYPMDYPKPALSFGAPWRPRACLAVSSDLKTFERRGILLPDSDNKDVVLFPEKIGGKWVMIHREFPHMWLAYSDDMAQWEGHTRIMEPEAGVWDCNRIGAGAPPFQTELGWVEIYHGVDADRYYGLGISLHDLEHPDRVLARSPEPILWPEEWYEKEGIVPNVCFTCGVVRQDDNYLVYYGAADKYMAVATVSHDDLIAYLKSIMR